MLNVWAMLECSIDGDEAELGQVNLGCARGVFMQLRGCVETGTNIVNRVACCIPGGHYCFGRPAATAFLVVAGRHAIDGDGPGVPSG